MIDLEAYRRRARETGDGVAALREIAPGWCVAFGAERLTVYVALDDGRRLRSIVNTGLFAIGDRGIELPVDRESIAGYVATQRRVVNIADAYDKDELAAHDPPVRFLKAYDQRTGFRTRQVLAAPILGEGEAALLGILQILNRIGNERFPAEVEAQALALGTSLREALGPIGRQLAAR